MEPTKGGGVPLHVNPTDPEVIGSRNDARIGRLRLKLAELVRRRERGETGPAVADSRIAERIAELQRRGGMPPVTAMGAELARKLRAAGLSDAAPAEINRVFQDSYHSAILKDAEGGK